MILTEDTLTPREQDWLNRYRATCCTRRRNFIHNGRLLTIMGHNKNNPRYGSIAGMGGQRMWEWIKYEVRRIERQDKRRLAREVRNSIGQGI